MTRSPFIRDDELRDKFGDAAELIIDALDRDPQTQKQEGKGTRDRQAVEAFLAERAKA